LSDRTVGADKLKGVDPVIYLDLSGVTADHCNNIQLSRGTMKIGFVTGAYLPAPGGVTTSVVNFRGSLGGSDTKLGSFARNTPKRIRKKRETYTVLPHIIALY